MADFVHLHVHTEFSLLDGLSKIPQLVARAKNQGQKALAITDHGTMYGVVKFYLEAKKAGIKPIIGVEAYMSEFDHTQKQTRMGADQFHLPLFAKNETGYKNLMRLVSIAHLDGFSYKPRIDIKLLEQHGEGLVATSGCLQGIIARKLAENNTKGARDWAKKFVSVFGDNFYIELQSHTNNQEVMEMLPKLVSLSRDLGIPLVATNDVHYVDPDDAEAQDALLAVQTRKTISDSNRMSMLSSPDYYLRSSEDMASLFAEYPDAVANSVKIAEMCEVEIPIGKMIFPEYPIPGGETSEDHLKNMVEDRLDSRYKKVSDEIRQRIDYELEVIIDKGYSTYFLIVQDFVNWAKEMGIRVGPGRGSAAGSIVSYITGITDVDPIMHNIPFERFLNPQRPSPPDIDIDIADERRDEVIRYVAKKYGEDHVAQIITFGTMEARAAIRDIGRVLGMDYSEPDRIAKLIPLGFSIEEAMINVFELQEFYRQEKYKKLIDLAKKVEGSARHASTHAAGVVIADKPLIEYTPIQRESRGGKVVTQYDMYDMDLNISEDAIGLLKMDFLGLRNLSILGRAIDLVEKRKGVRVELTDIPLDDKKVFAALSKGETTGMFQLESSGMRRVARQLKPSRFSDITAMVALFRPGPMELISDFVKGKNNPKTVKYPHPDLKEVLEETYGIPVYQEQVLQIANVIAGYSLGEADILRRAIGKKKKSIMDKEKKKFADGAKKKGYTDAIAKKIWSFIDKFAGYGFNKAHSVSYAMIAYETAYMKLNYPLEYMTALLSIESQSGSANRDAKIMQVVDDCARLKIEILPPDINKSQIGFTIEGVSSKKDAIRYGLSAVKNVGGVAVESVLESREAGEFLSLTDFCARVDNRKVNKKVVESLIRVGAMDRFGRRSAMLASLDSIRDQASVTRKQESLGQSGLFDEVGTKVTAPVDKLPDMDEMPKSEILLAEKELLGIYLTDNPLAERLNTLRREVEKKIDEIDSEMDDSKKVRVGGIVVRVQQVTTKKSNAEMAFVTIEDETGKIELVVFPKVYEDNKGLLVVDKVVIVTGILDNRGDKMSIKVDNLTSVNSDSDLTRGIELKIPRGTSKAVLAQVGKTLKDNLGEEMVTLLLPNGKNETRLQLPYGVDFNKEVRGRIASLLDTRSDKQ